MTDRAGDGRRLLVARPHGFCAGVRRALALAQRALAELPPGSKIYCLHELVHNGLVVRRLAARGMVFVSSLDEVPDGERVFFSAHGVSPAVRAEAARRGLAVTDSTCGFVDLLHASVRRLAGEGRTVLFIGTPGHDETEGVAGEAPGRVFVVRDAEEAEALRLPADTPLAVLTQTTLASRQAAPVMEALSRKFPGMLVPERRGTCVATEERQEAVRRVARDAGLVIVLGSPTSANSRRLAEVAQAEGARAALLQDLAEVEAFAAAGGMDGVECIGLTAGASTPEDVVESVLEWLGECGFNEEEQRDASAGAGGD